MKLFRSGFWAKAVICLIILLEFAGLIAFFYLLATGLLASQYAIVFLIVVLVLNAVTVLVIINSAGQTDYKVSWLAALGAIPVLGLVFYLLFAHKLTSPWQRSYMKKYETTMEHISSDISPLIRLEKQSPSSAKIARYIQNAGDCPIYRNTSVTYFPLGDDAFPVMLEELKKAKHYIFLEYFIIHPGKFWNSILAVLEEKAKAGLDIRVVYDDVGSLSTLPANFRRSLEAKGIRCRVFSPIYPFLDIRMNNRDHRKILVIDGHTAFSGGINLADEYINEVKRFGHWKDNAVMLKGKAVESLTFLFLANWCASFDTKKEINYDYYRPETFIDEIGGFPASDGYVQPYGDVPYDEFSIGAGVYSSIITRSRKYLYISTPYLILDSRLKDELVQASLSGVDVRILTPGIPDKKLVFSLTRSNYGPLLKAGVKIYEYSPGFVHQKMFVSDDEVATCGTINVDYRALYLHMENGVFLAHSSVVSYMKNDFLSTLEVSKEIDYASWKKKKRKLGLWWALLKVFCPLL